MTNQTSNKELSIVPLYCKGARILPFIWAATIPHRSWERNFGRSPRYTMTNKRCWDRGCLEVQIQVEKGRIADIAFFGDFLSICPLSGLTDGLKDTAYTKEAFAAVLDQYPLEQCFGGITREEVLETAFNIDRSPAAKPGGAGIQEA